MEMHRTILNPELKQLTEKFFSEAKNIVFKKHPISQPINFYIDQTLLKPEATLEQIEKLCENARTYDFRAVCIQPHYLNKTRELLRGTNVMPITVIGFPLGVNNTATKVFETKNAVDLGAKEIDMVINISAMKSGEYDFIYQDIKDVVLAASGVPVKVIVETAYLNLEEKIIACACVSLSGAKYIKTSTGFAPTHAQLDDIKLFKHLLKDSLKIKASGGIKNLEQAKTFIEAGADRVGTSSGVEIIKGQDTSKEDY
jgi:deoxyribose-phosphate aldolase